jgi:simple sugar transport system substrate-binding protein
MRKLLFALTAAVALGMAANAEAADKVKACFVYVGSHTDGG